MTAHSVLQTELQQKATELLENQKANVVIGYGLLETGEVGAVFITSPKQTHQLIWNEHCTDNLTTYLARKEIKRMGTPCIIVKGCDAKTLAILESENQIVRENLIVMGIVCSGVQVQGKTQNKCLSCDVHNPPHCDIVIGELISVETQADRYAKLAHIESMTSEQRFAYWKKELARCIKCYACRQNCPLCYCNVCVADKNQPTRIDTSATLKGNFAWNILRAFHLAGRCVGCSACAKACPVGIDLDLLNLTLAKVAEENFQFRAGVQRGAEPLIGTFSPDDQEAFIR